MTPDVTDSLEFTNFGSLHALLLNKMHNRYGSSGNLKIGKWVITATQTVDASYSKYSNRWHRSHGAAYSIKDRAIRFVKKHGRGYITKVVPVSRWDSSSIARAAKLAGITPEKSDAPMSVRLDKAYDAKRLEDCQGCHIYERTFLGVHVDFVAVKDGVTYHSDSVERSVAYVEQKITKLRSAAPSEKTGEDLIDLRIAHSYGFCVTGIHQFCIAFDLNIGGRYTVNHIMSIAGGDIGKADLFRLELRALSRIYNVKCPV